MHIVYARVLEAWYVVMSVGTDVACTGRGDQDGSEYNEH